jgi:succinate dehydrogenase / fumarate reductase, cytochrome b subunit
MAQPSKRPLSPHLGVYKWGPHMVVSILHRVAGDGMAFVGATGLIWWLIAAASGTDSYGLFMGWANHWSGQIVMIGMTLFFFQHLCSGLRHFVLDTGAGYELDSNRIWSLVVLFAPTLMTAALWIFIYTARVTS